MKNITLSADEKLIEAAHARAGRAHYPERAVLPLAGRIRESL